jgi:hypothetical protein
MVSLTREQFGGVVPGAGTGPMSRMWRRMRGSDEADERQQRWWDERRTSAVAAAGGRPESSRAESATAAAPSDWFGSGRRRQPEVSAADSSAIQPSRRALPAGTGGAGATTGGWPGWSDPGAVDDRVIYRRPDSVIARAGAVRPVEPELVNGRPVYRIYRPRDRRPVVDWTGPGRAH